MQIPTAQTSQLGTNASYMTKLLYIVKEKMNSVAVDITMKFTLSALWNLTDESPSTCEIFLQEGGLELFLSVLEVNSFLSSLLGYIFFSNTDVRQFELIRW